MFDWVCNSLQCNLERSQVFEIKPDYDFFLCHFLPMRSLADFWPTLKIKINNSHRLTICEMEECWLRSIIVNLNVGCKPE